MVKSIQTDTLIVGAGASGLFCAMTAGQNGKKVTIIDHANKAGLKILMSGGGRCNFTNYSVEPENYVGSNSHFCKSALTRYSNWDFISLIETHQIPYHEKEHGQLFCDKSAKDILNMLLSKCEQVDVDINLKTEVVEIEREKTGFIVTTKTISRTEPEKRIIHCQSLVIATGGLSIPTKGATGLGYQIAQQFGHEIIPTSASLVPFTFTGKLGEMFASLSGMSLDVIAFNDRISFSRPLLFTHRGLSGFAMLQLSNYWQSGETIHLNLAPNHNLSELLITAKRNSPKQKIRTVLNELFPKKLLLALQNQLWHTLIDVELANIKDGELTTLGRTLNDWEIKPSGTEGYRTAEVTLGGISTEHVSSKTFESKLQPNLYFIGEVLDVTGWLGGYNFQWAWASAHACGQAIK